MSQPSTELPEQPLPREEYIEQEYFFRVYRERLEDGVPSQEILKSLNEEVLATAQLPLAIDFMRAEILHTGRTSSAMERLPHYFSAYQTMVIMKAEDEVSRFEMPVALKVLEREARYRADGPSCAGLFLYQFESLARNRLGYTAGLTAMATDSSFSAPWQQWIRSLRNDLGANELPQLVFMASEHLETRRRQRSRTLSADGDRPKALFGEQEGRIARANIGREPLYFFAALQRQLNYPQVPLSRKVQDERLPAFLEERLVKMEQRMKIVEMEQKGGIDLSKFYEKQGD